MQSKQVFCNLEIYDSDPEHWYGQVKQNEDSWANIQEVYELRNNINILYKYSEYISLTGHVGRKPWGMYAWTR